MNFQINKSLFLVVGLLATTSIAFGQKDSKPLDFKVKGAENDTVYLANYYGGKLYYADTAYSDSKGNFSFKEKPRDEGKYAIVLPGPRYFEFLLADNEKVKMETDTADFVKDMKVISSDNNKELYDYISFINKEKAKRDSLENLYKNAKSNEKPKLEQDLKDLNKQVVNYQTEFVKKNKGKFVATDVSLTIDPIVPDSITNDKAHADRGYYYYRKHYWDNTDLTDPRIVNTAMFSKKLDAYLNKVLPQIPDTIIPIVDKLIAKVADKPELFKYITHYSTYNAETSKVMGMDKMFVHMVDTYYNTGRAFWMDSTDLADIQKRASKLSPLLLGEKSPNIILQDTTGKWVNLYKDVHAPFTLLYFYDVDCGHCQKETPKLVDYYNVKGKKQGLKVYAVSADAGEKWMKFIHKYGIQDFINVIVPAKAFNDENYATQLVMDGKTTVGSLNYHDTFDVYATPKIFLLDKDKNIIAKQIGVEQIGDFIDHFEQTHPDYMKSAQ